MTSKPTASESTTAQDPVIAEHNTIAEQKREAPRKRIPLASIPVTILIGLLIAALYLGGRIFTARRVQKPAPAIHNAMPAMPHPAPVEAKAVSQPVQPEAKPVAPAAQALTPKPRVAEPEPARSVSPASNSSADGLPMIQPHSGERYIQVGALDPDANDTRRFVERLRQEGMNPHVAQGPTPELMRVLIGPFANLDALNEKKAQIESEGIDTFVREY